MQEGTIRVQVETYRITDGRYSIYLCVNPDGDLVLTPGDKGGARDFNFVGSSQELVRSIAKLMLRAVDVAEKEHPQGGCPSEA